MHYRHPFLFLPLLYGVCFLAQANDPFDKTRRNNTQGEQPVLQTVTQCADAADTQAADVPFAALKIIGFLQHKDKRKILFSDDKQRVFIASTGVRIAQEKLGIRRIERQEVQFDGWRTDCSVGNSFSVKF